MSVIVKLYLFLLPVVNAFNFSAMITIPFIVSILLSFIVIIKGRIRRIEIMDYLVILFILSTFFSIFLNLHYVNITMINHFIGIFAVFFIYYFIVSNEVLKIEFDTILNILLCSYYLVALFAFVEFVAINYFQIDFNFIPRPTVENYNPSFLGLFIRARSFFEESGYLAGYQAVLAPLLYYYTKETFYKKLLFYIASIVMSLVAFSISFFLFFPMAIILALILNVKKLFPKINLKIILNIFIIIFLIIILYFLNQEIINQFLSSSIQGKFESNSYDDRYKKFINTLNLMYNCNIVNLVFGFGSGSYTYLMIEQSISVYINFFRDFGLLGIVLFLSFNLYNIVLLIRNQEKINFYLLISILVLNLFYISTPHYFYPHYFLIYALVLKINIEERKKIAKKS